MIIPLTSAELIVQILERAGIESHRLDEIVHNCMSQEAAAVNNGGLFAQVTYLMGACGSVEAYILLKETLDLP